MEDFGVQFIDLSEDSEKFLTVLISFCTPVGIFVRIYISFEQFTGRHRVKDETSCSKLFFRSLLLFWIFRFTFFCWLNIYIQKHALICQNGWKTENWAVCGRAANLESSHQRIEILVDDHGCQSIIHPARLLSNIWSLSLFFYLENGTTTFYAINLLLRYNKALPILSPGIQDG